MGTTTYSKDDWDNGAMTNSKVTRTMGNWNNGTPRPTVSDSNNCTACRSINQIDM